MMIYTPIRQIQVSACGYKGDSGLSISRHSIAENAITKVSGRKGHVCSGVKDVADRNAAFNIVY
jgi:hypothetical protein